MILTSGYDFQNCSGRHAWGCASLEDTEESKAKLIREKKDLKEARWKKRVRAVHLHLDGPASLRVSERYGNSFAKIFPVY